MCQKYMEDLEGYFYGLFHVFFCGMCITACLNLSHYNNTVAHHDFTDII